MNTFDRVAKVLKELSGLDEIKPDDHLQNDLALDSLLMITMAFPPLLYMHTVITIP